MRREAGELCIHEHTDVSLFTLLAVEPGPDGRGLQGLECIDGSGQWRRAAPGSGEVLLLAGELLEEMTAGRVKATRHRVVLPASDSTVRLSAVYFVTPTADFDVGGGVSYTKWRRRRVKRAIKTAAKPLEQ